VTPSITASPTQTITPTITPTNSPTQTPTLTPTVTPTNSLTPTNTPTNTPTESPAVYSYQFDLIDCCTELREGLYNINVIGGQSIGIGYSIFIDLGNGSGPRCYYIQESNSIELGIYLTTSRFDFGYCSLVECSGACPSPTPTTTSTPTPTPTLPELVYEITPCRGGETYYANFAIVGPPTTDVVYINSPTAPEGCYIVLGSSLNAADTFIQFKVDYDSCLECEAGPASSPTPTPTRTATPTVTPTVTPTKTSTPAPTTTPTRTVTPTRTSTPTPTSSVCTTQITINWAIQTCARGTFSILVNGSSVYIKNALGIAGSGSDTITVPYGSTITLNGSALNISGGGCVGIYDTSAINMTPSFGGANGVGIVRVSDGTPNNFSYSYTKTCPTTVITLDYVPNPI
jgi:hypothetical protein